MKRAEVQKLKEYPVVKTYPFVPEPPSKGVVIKTLFCGVCHSDLHLWENASTDSKFPTVYGHEVSGRIHSFGLKANKHGLSAGDNVVVYPWFGCEACQICQSGQHSHCMDRAKEIGCGADGGYSDYVVVPDSKFLIKVPESIPMDIACMLPCSGLTSYSALMRAKPYIAKENGHVLVIGAGGLGLWCLQWIKTCLPVGTKVVSADISEEKLEIALNRGARDTILLPKVKKGMPAVSDELLNEMFEKSDGGFDAVLDFVNSSDSSQRGFASLKKNGIHVAVGLFGGIVSLDLCEVARKMKMFAGSYTGALQELKDLIKLVATSEVMPPPISHHTLDEVADIWRQLAEGKVRGRALIKHD